MTKTEATAAIEAQTKIEAGKPGTEDYDTGWIVEMIDADMAMVSWDSGVKTKCPIEFLREVA